jgi:uncharacterized protein involved in outer membrane biogenesis
VRRSTFLAALIALPVLLLGLAAAAAAWLATADLRPWIESKASDSLGRSVRIGGLAIGWGDPLKLEIHDLRIANAPWGSRPDMATVDRIAATVDVWPLLHGVIRYERLETSRPDILLERGPDGSGNWKFPGAGQSSGGGFALVPKDRTQFPTLLDFALDGGRVTYITGSGKRLEIALDHVLIDTQGDDQPVTVNADGGYNGIPARLQATTQSFATLRDAAVPFGMDFALANDDGQIAFHGTAMLPLDFDGVDGALTIDMQRVATLLQAFGADVPAPFAAALAGALARNGDHWRLRNARGELAANPFTGALTLDEGPRGGSDKIDLDVAFGKLLADALLPKPAAGGGQAGSGKPGGDAMQSPLSTPAPQAPEVTARFSAKQLTFRGIQVADVGFSGSAAPGRITVDELKLAAAGGTLKALGGAKAVGAETSIEFNAGVTGADIRKLLDTFGLGTDQIAGEVSARSEISIQGRTLGAALARSRGSVTLAMVGGRVSRDLLEKASADLRSLFRSGEGMAPVRCLLGVAAIEKGVATVAPLKLVTNEATLRGGGTVDLAKGTVDLRIQADPKSTGFLALDLPIRISGTFDAVSAKPAAKADTPAPQPAALSEAARRMAEASNCLD